MKKIVYLEEIGYCTDICDSKTSRVVINELFEDDFTVYCISREETMLFARKVNKKKFNEITRLRFRNKLKL